MVVPGNREPGRKTFDGLHPFWIALHHGTASAERCACRRFMHQPERPGRASRWENHFRQPFIWINGERFTATNERRLVAHVAWKIENRQRPDGQQLAVP